MSRRAMAVATCILALVAPLALPLPAAALVPGVDYPAEVYVPEGFDRNLIDDLWDPLANAKYFGEAIDLQSEPDGSVTAVFGAWGNRGAAFVARRDVAGTWTPTAWLKPPPGDDPGVSMYFGRDVDISGDTLAIAAPGAKLGTGFSSLGAVYVYGRDGAGAWSLEQRLTAPSGHWRYALTFGASVALDGDTVAVGATGWSGTSTSLLNIGKVYVFERSGGTWGQVQELTDPAGDSQDFFGFDLDLDAGRMLVGAPYDEGGRAGGKHGSAVMFRDTGSGWAFETHLRPSRYNDDGHHLYSTFGYDVDLDGPLAIVGAPTEDHLGAPQDAVNHSNGAAYVYRLGAAWAEEARLVATDPQNQAQFGYAVAIDGAVAVVGAPYHDTAVHSGTGRMYAFVRGFAGWKAAAELDDPEAVFVSNLGEEVAVLGGLALGGSPNAKDYAGRVSVFVPAPRPDLVVEPLALPEDARHGQALALAATVRNAGPGDAGPFRVRFTLDGAVLGEAVLPGLAAGQSAAAVAPAWSAVLGPHDLAVLADSGAEVAELDEANNGAAGGFTVHCQAPGPDDAGYTCRLVAAAPVPMDGAATLALGDDALSLPLALPFAFPFYGDAYLAAAVGSDGFLTFAPLGEPGPPAGALPSEAGPDLLVAGFWGDLDPSAGGTVRHRSTDEVFAVEFREVPHAAGPGLATFQIQLWADGRIRVVLLDVAGDGAPRAVGLEDLVGTTGLAAATGALRLQGLAVEFAPGPPPLPPGWEEDSLGFAFPPGFAAAAPAQAKATVTYRHAPGQHACPPPAPGGCPLALPVDPADPAWVAGKMRYARAETRLEASAGGAPLLDQAAVAPAAGQGLGMLP